MNQNNKDQIWNNIQLYQRACLGAFQNVNPFTSSLAINSRYSLEEYGEDGENAIYSCNYLKSIDHPPIKKFSVPIKHLFSSVTCLDHPTMSTDQFMRRIGLKLMMEHGKFMAKYIIDFIFAHSTETVHVKNINDWLYSATTFCNPYTDKKKGITIAHPYFIDQLKDDFIKNGKSIKGRDHNSWEIWESEILKIYACPYMPKETAFLFTENSLLVPILQLPDKYPYLSANDRDANTLVSIRFIYDSFGKLQVDVSHGIDYIPGSLTKVIL